MKISQVTMEQLFDFEHRVSHNSSHLPGFHGDLVLFTTKWEWDHKNKCTKNPGNSVIFLVRGLGIEQAAAHFEFMAQASPGWVLDGIMTRSTLSWCFSDGHAMHEALAAMKAADAKKAGQAA